MQFILSHEILIHSEMSIIIMCSMLFYSTGWRLHVFISFYTICIGNCTLSKNINIFYKQNDKIVECVKKTKQHKRNRTDDCAPLTAHRSRKVKRHKNKWKKNLKKNVMQWQNKTLTLVLAYICAHWFQHHWLNERRLKPPSHRKTTNRLRFAFLLDIFSV